MQGKRHDLAEDEYSLEPGEYGRDPDGLWFARPPVEKHHVGGLQKHTVVEHEDGTITVSPSIVWINVEDGTNGWHGYLERGIWREV